MVLTNAEANAVYRAVLRRDATTAELTQGVRADNARALAETLFSADVSQAINSEVGTIVLPMVRMYQAAFGRIPDNAGLDYWVGQIRAGTHSIDSAATFFIGTPEAAARRIDGTVSHSDYVGALYTNVLGREPDPGGMAFWLGEVNSGARSRARVLGDFVAGSEFALDTTPFARNMLLGVASQTIDQDTLANGQVSVRSITSPMQSDFFGAADSGAITGGATSDNLTGSADNDSIYGNNGNDTIVAGEGNDTIRGGAGNDTILGNTGNDALYGNTGNDSLTGGAGNDTITGGAGSDRILLDDLGGTDTITDFTPSGRNAAAFDQIQLHISNFGLNAAGSAYGAPAAGAPRLVIASSGESVVGGAAGVELTGGMVRNATDVASLITPLTGLDSGDRLLFIAYSQSDAHLYVNTRDVSGTANAASLVQIANIAGIDNTTERLTLGDFDLIG